MRVYAMVDGSVQRKGSTEEKKKISKISEAKRRIWGLGERETSSIAAGAGRTELCSPYSEDDFGCLLNLSGYQFPNL